MLATALVDTFIVPLKNQVMNAKILPEIKLKSSSQNICLKLANSNTHNFNRNKKSSFGPSSFPILDEFINKTLANRKGLSGSIRSWSMDNENIITYFMKGNRWCENINRSHKSNNIMWNVSLCDGKYWQSCFDPDCQFRGFVKELPVNVKNSLNDFVLNKAIEVDDDFEKALMQLNLGKEDGTDSTRSNSFNVDDEFNEALMNLNISNHFDTKTDDVSNNIIGGGLKNSTEEASSQQDNFHESKENKTQKGNEVSFDSDFALVLADAISNDPSLCI